MSKVVQGSTALVVPRGGLTTSDGPNFSSYEEKTPSGGSPYGPTGDTYGALLAAFAFYNDNLFGGVLPPCLITLQRSRGCYGYFCGNRFAEATDADKRTSEIAMNPKYMARRTDEENLGTLVHEMAHHWQFYFSAYASRRLKGRAYHDREWAAKMEEIGLIPSTTGVPGGKKTGPRVSHYILEGGTFQQVTAMLLASGLTLKWADAKTADRRNGGKQEPRKKRDQSKRKFTCPNCGQNAWANHSAELRCGNSSCAGAPMRLAD